MLAAAWVLNVAARDLPRELPVLPAAGWLTATERGISVLPLSAPVEVSGTRDTMHRLLSYLNHPFLVLRLGTVDAADTDAPYVPRVPAEQIIQRPDAVL